MHFSTTTLLISLLTSTTLAAPLQSYHPESSTSHLNHTRLATRQLNLNTTESPFTFPARRRSAALNQTLDGTPTVNVTRRAAGRRTDAYNGTDTAILYAEGEKIRKRENEKRAAKYSVVNVDGGSGETTATATETATKTATATAIATTTATATEDITVTVTPAATSTSEAVETETIVYASTITQTLLSTIVEGGATTTITTTVEVPVPGPTVSVSVYPSQSWNATTTTTSSATSMATSATATVSSTATPTETCTETPAPSAAFVAKRAFMKGARYFNGTATF